MVAHITNLKKMTKEYWRQLDYIPDYRLTTNYYIEELLPQEIKYARERGNLPSDVSDCKHLVMLVGHSVEPILQSIYTYNPDEITLVMNASYGEELTGNNMRQYISKEIEELFKIHKLDRNNTKTIHHVVLPKDAQQTHIEVFKLFVKEIQDTKGLLIDITGAKKSMVAGAFLFATFTGTDVTYVDFADSAYDSKKRRPYGYGCIIKKLDNPYQAFGLRDWETIRNFYQNYRFADALVLLDDNLVQTMETYLPGSKNAVELLIKIIECYKEWDRGQYDKAYTLYEKITKINNEFQPPDAISLLGKSHHVNENNGNFLPIGSHNWLTDYYDGDKETFRVYLRDELARIKRLLVKVQDFRSVVIRSASLNEVVNLARLVKQLDDSSIHSKDDLLEALRERTPPAKKLFEQLCKREGTNFSLTNIPRQRGWPQNLRDIQFKITKSLSWMNELPMHGSSLGKSGVHFLYYRNHLVHCYYAPSKKLAQDTYNFIEKNINDFLKEHNSEHHNTEIMNWEEICRLTGLATFLPQPLTRNQIL